MELRVPIAADYMGSMKGMQLKIRSLSLEGHTEDLESIGFHLSRALESAAERGPFPPLAVAVRNERAD